MRELASCGVLRKDGGVRTITIATRGSRLALEQTDEAVRLLRSAFPNRDFRVVPYRTTGDLHPTRPLHKLGANGVFTKQLESALLAGQVDMCVHSMKDVPSTLPAGCCMAAMLPRADARDALVCGPRVAGVRALADLPAGARVGTGSLRRAAQLRASFPHLVPTALRGNVDTRLAKSQGPDYDAVILAAAGVRRMGCQEAISGLIPPTELIPAAGQGAIGVEVRADDAELLALCAAIDDPATHRYVDAERAVLAAVGGSCKVPIGVYATADGGVTSLDAIVLSVDGSRAAHSRRERAGADPMYLVPLVLEDLEAQGAREILAQIDGGR